MAKGYQAIAASEPERVRLIDADETVEVVSAAVWDQVEPLITARV